MKTVIFILTFLFVCSSVMAAVSFFAEDNGDGSFTISYTTTDGELPRGIALTISCTDGATCDPADGFVSADAAYNTYIDWAYSNLSGYEIGDGHPLAEMAGAGALAAPASEFSICMGVLDQDGNQAAGPASSANLITLQLSGGPCEVTIDVDALRGGVVGEGGQLATDLPIVLFVLFVLSNLVEYGSVVGVISLFGAAYLIYLGIENLSVKTGILEIEVTKGNALKWGIVTNFLSPSPYLFWLSIGGPMVFKSLDIHVSATVLFILGFYSLLIGSKIGIAMVVEKSKSFIESRYYLYVVRALGIVLVLFALIFVMDGLKLIGLL